MLDASKAFDCVNLLTLFTDNDLYSLREKCPYRTMLLKRDMSTIFFRFLMYNYCDQQLRENRMV